MQFHNYKTMKPHGWRGTTEDYIRHVMVLRAHRDEHQPETMRSAIEMGWLGCDRPFYNVYPIAVELCQKTAMGMKWGDILFPSRYLLLRFASGHEPLGLEGCLLRVPSAAKQVTPINLHKSRMEHARWMKDCQLAGCIRKAGYPGDRVTAVWTYPAGDIRDQVVADTAGDWDGGAGLGQSCRGEDREQVCFLIKLLAFIGLLARGTDLITPAILAADREEYDATSDEARKRWLEQRAARRQGRGFDIGRSMEIQRATSPHWRCPHPAVFHTGPGRTIPVLKIRSGCVVVPKDMSQVPTGYLGPEKEGEEHKELPAVFRTPIPSKMRFQVLRRDGYRCRLCGMTAEDGITLECDHIIAVAKGGKTEPPNLWTLCRPCNNGKSDSDLHLALEENLAMEKARKEVKRGIRV